MSERLNLVEERRYLRAISRATEQMKAAQRTSNNLVLFITKRKCTGISDAIKTRSHMTRFLSDRIGIEIYRTQTTVAVPCWLQFTVGDNDTLAGAQIIGGSIIDQSYTRYQ